MAIFVIFLFFIMLVFGGIAVDVMRAETRRVALVQTLDRAALASAALTQERSPSAVANEWYQIAGLGDTLTYDYSPVVPDVTDVNGLRRVKLSAEVRSYNFFMGMGFMPVDHLDAPATTEAAQGVSQIEVMLVLDITGSMNGMSESGTNTKIADLRTYAQEFVDIVKDADSQNGVSIGMVPYAAQVNIPENLRQQFTVTNLSSWDGVANRGVPNINCIEMPQSSYTSVSLSQETPMPMAAVADTVNGTTNTSNYVAPVAPDVNGRICTTLNDNAGTGFNESLMNHVVMPSKDGTPVKSRIAQLVANGNTSIALGMRWGTALLDEAARPIYAAIADPSVAGRPANNDDHLTRKIIVLMTDGEHVSNTHIYDAFKTGPSPIWRGTDGNFAIQFTNGGPALTGGTRPGGSATSSCSGWTLTNYANRTFFVPHLKRNSVRQRVGTNPEGAGTGTSVAGACDPQSWIAGPTPTWAGSGVVRRLDWSEVWRFVRVSWVARQLYMRSGVTGTNDYNTIMNQFRGTYISVSQLNSLLQQNCTAAKQAGIEIYGIAFSAPAGGEAQIQACANNVEQYYFDAQNGEDLRSAFRMIATDISDLRLTQ